MFVHLCKLSKDEMVEGNHQEWDKTGSPSSHGNTQGSGAHTDTWIRPLQYILPLLGCLWLVAL